MNKESVRDRLLHLYHCRGIGWTTLHKMFQFDSTLESIFTLSSQEFIDIFNIPRSHINQLLYDLRHKNACDLVLSYRKKHIKVITIIDDDYPQLLKHIYRPPWVLFCLGNTKLLQETKNLAFVGSRKPTNYGCLVTKKLVSALVNKNYLITSGLAKGIDYESHIQALYNKGQTIAVIAGGFNHIYPREHARLAHEISKNHLLISEYPPDTKPQKYQFPERNRIISGLTIGTVVIEAKARSGSLITALQALENGREVFAVPGPITSETSKGTNWLIQQGAKLITSHEDILMELTGYTSLNI